MTPEQIQNILDNFPEPLLDEDDGDSETMYHDGDTYSFFNLFANDVREILTQALEIAKGDKVVKCNLCHKDMIKLLDAHDMIKLLLPLAKGYVNANSGIRSTECIIEDAEAMIAVAEG